MKLINLNLECKLFTYFRIVLLYVLIDRCIFLGYFSKRYNILQAIITLCYHSYKVIGTKQRVVTTFIRKRKEVVRYEYIRDNIFNDYVLYVSCIAYLLNSISNKGIIGKKIITLPRAQSDYFLIIA